MATPDSDWSTDSTAAVTISLVTPGDGTHKNLASFHPKFTYPIFGDEESIFGYKGLKIHLKYHASDMRPNLQVTYNKKYKAVGDVAPTDIKAVLEDFLPAAAFEKSAHFDSNINSDLNDEWKPPGELLKSYSKGTETFEIWKGSLADKAVQQIIKRIQILVPFFIEGGTFIDLEDAEWSLQRWTVFFLFKKSAEVVKGISPYTFMGYSTVYRYYLFRLPATQSVAATVAPTFELPFSDMNFSDVPCRSRISQFIILPSSQGAGHGSRLYETMFQHYLADPSTIEITVEDPNEAFDDLRDYNDLAHLRTVPEFKALKINTSATARPKGPIPTNDIISMSTLEAVRQSQKIAPRQFGRLVEMQLLSHLPTYIRQSLILETKKGTKEEIKSKEHEYYLWKLFVKQRLYRHNKQTLMQLERAERIDKLEEAVGSVEADYARLLRGLESNAVEGKKVLHGEGAKGIKRSREEDEEEALEDGEEGPKRARVENDDA